MDTLVWVFAGVVLFDVAVVALVVLVREVERRRDQHRELELLYDAPSVPVIVALSRGGRRGARGRHLARGPRRPQEVMRTASFALAVVAIGAVVAAAVVSPVSEPGGSTFAAADGVSGDRFVRRPTVDPGQETSASTRRDDQIDTEPGQQGAIDEPIDFDAPGANVVESGGDPTVPAVVVAAPTSATSIRIEWEPVPMATGYEVDRFSEDDPAAEGGWLKIAEPEAGVSTFTDTGLDSATTYYYRVTAMLEGSAEAPASDVVHATTMIAPPDTPTLSVHVAGNKVVLHWTDVEDETGYRIERLVPGSTEWALLDTTAAGVVSARDLDTSASGTFQYRVIATGLGGDSAPSNIAEIDPSIAIGELPPSEEPSETAPDVIEPDAVDPAATAPDAIEPDEAPSD